MSSGIRQTLINQVLLEDTTRAELFELFQVSYDGVTRERFYEDLASKSLVLLFRDESQKVIGFTTFGLLIDRRLSLPAYALFSGDTLIHPDFRGSQMLVMGWIHTVATHFNFLAPHRLDWLLIVKGDKTYRYLPTFFNSYVPSRRQATSPEDQLRLDYYAQLKFADFYDIKGGVVKFGESLGHLNKDEAATSLQKRHHPDVAFFLEKNPGYARGEELVCMTQILSVNFRSWSRKVFNSCLAAPSQLIWDKSGKQLILSRGYETLFVESAGTDASNKYTEPGIDLACLSQSHQFSS